MTVEAMNEIANHVSSIPGRKSMVWISGGLPIQLGMANIGKAAYGGSSAIGDTSTANRLTRPDREAVKFDEMVKQLADTLNRSNIAMYAIDAKGVELDPTMDVSGRGPRLTDQVRRYFGAKCRAGRSRFHRSCWRIARAVWRFLGTMTLSGAIRRAFDDGRYAYNIAFYPNHGEWDGKFRTIKIRVQGRRAAALPLGLLRVAGSYRSERGDRRCPPASREQPARRNEAGHDHQRQSEGFAHSRAAHRYRSQTASLAEFRRPSERRGGLVLPATRRLLASESPRRNSTSN